MERMESLLTTGEVAAFLKLDDMAVRRLVAGGALAAYQIGGELRFARSDLQSFLERSQAGRAEAAAPAELPGVLAAREIELLMPALSTRARYALTLAREECEGHGYFGTEHLLLGLVREGSGVAARVLDELGIALDAVRGAVAEGVEWPERPAARSGDPQATAMAREALRQALAHGGAWDDAVIGTEHLLFGLSKVLGSNSALLLELLGTTCDTVEAEVLRHLGRQPIG